MRAKNEETTEEKVAKDESPFKPSNSSEPQQKKNTEGLADSKEPSGQSTTNIAADSEATVTSHNVELLKTIDEELGDATPEWRNEVFQDLKGVEPAMVPVMLRTYKQAWQLSQKRSANQNADPIAQQSQLNATNPINGLQANIDKTIPDQSISAINQSEPIIPSSVPPTGLGTTNPWNRPQSNPPTNQSIGTSMPVQSRDQFPANSPIQVGNTGLRSPSQLTTPIPITGFNNPTITTNHPSLQGAPQLGNPAGQSAAQIPLSPAQPPGHSVTLGGIEFNNPAQVNQQPTNSFNPSAGPQLQQQGIQQTQYPTNSIPVNGLQSNINQAASDVNSRGLSVNQANSVQPQTTAYGPLASTNNTSPTQNPVILPGSMTTHGIQTAEHFNSTNSNTQLASQNSTLPPAQNVWQDSMAGPQAPWTAELEKLISLAETEVAQLDLGTTDTQRDNYIRKHVHLRMLYLMAGRHERALQAVPYLDPEDQEFWQQMFWGVSNYFDTQGMPNSADRATQTIAQLKSATLRLQGKARLELRHVTFCHKIASYGNYERFKRDEFSPGQPVLVYAEVDNFKSEPAADGQFRTILKSTVEIYKAGPSGDLVHREEFPATEDLCQNQRRDYFHSYEITIPQRISLGPHVMKLTVEDQLNQKIATYSLNFTVK